MGNAIIEIYMYFVNFAVFPCPHLFQKKKNPATLLIDYKLELYHGLVLEARALCPARLKPAHGPH